MLNSELEVAILMKFASFGKCLQENYFYTVWMGKILVFLQISVLDENRRKWAWKCINTIERKWKKCVRKWLWKKKLFIQIVCVSYCYWQSVNNECSSQIVHALGLLLAMWNEEIWAKRNQNYYKINWRLHVTIISEFQKYIVGTIWIYSVFLIIYSII